MKSLFCSGLAAILLVGMTASCEDALEEPVVADGSAGAAGGADSGTGGTAGTGGSGGSIVPEGGADAESPDSASDGAPSDAPAEASCSGSTKECSGQCVSIDDPAWGCTASSCTACDLPHATAGCASGACSVASCEPSWADCNATAADGCEVDLNTELTHCGACDSVCAFAQATASCEGGECKFVACESGYSDCDADTGNGCEANTQDDEANCGACGNVCAGTECKTGKCDNEPPVTLASSGAAPTDIALDADNVYWSSSTGVHRVAKSGGAPTVLAAAGEPRGIALDATHIYWTDASSFSVMSMSLSGGEAIALATGQEHPWRVATDGVHVYWTDHGAVRRVPVAGGDVVDIATLLPDPAGIVVDATHAYFTDATLGTVNRVPLAGGIVMQLASWQSSPMWLAVDATSVYFATNTANGAVKKVPVAGGSTV
ncbi:MAG TPA: hypothetical protein PLI95_21980, partial [Polyangiaceae bacterium]|nr:hypothetical protein [Polyangiaceae bacterium]